MIRLLPEAEAEVTESVRWYELQRAGLGRAFRTELRSVFARILKSPLIFPCDPNYRGSFDIRRCAFRRFSYHVIYTIEDSNVLVIAVAHNHRRPGYWSERLP